MLTRNEAVLAAHQWVDAWNAHDPDRVVEHFADDVVIHSPVAAQLRPESNGTLCGKPDVLAYYRAGLAASPGLRFTLVEVCTSVDGITIVYRNHRNTIVTEALTFDGDGRATEVKVSYGA
jgi:ketosteroid isomerase-like protein